MITVAADFGGTRIKLGLVRNRAVLARKILNARSQEGLTPQLPRVAAAVADLFRCAGVGRGECKSMGIAFPSIIEPRTGRILAEFGKYADALKLDLIAWTREMLGLDCVIENDARAALLGEWKAGAGHGCENLVMVTLGTGLGTSALSGGRLLRGKHGRAGVLGGHSSVQYRGAICHCGNRGCAEAEASTAALPGIAREHPDFLRSPLRDAGTIDYANVFRLAREADACAAALRVRSIEVWSALIVNLIHAYDPERVILGGGVMSGSADFFPELERIVCARVLTPWSDVKLFPAQLGDDAALIGCEVLVREKLRIL